MGHEAESNGNGKTLRLLLSVTIPLAIAGVIGTIVMYGQMSAMTTAFTSMQETVNKNYAELDKRLSRLENDIYTTRFSAKARTENGTPQPPAVP